MAELKRALGPVMLWGLGVGYVISGMYFGWNLGLPLGGTWGMLAAIVAATILYVTFIFSYTELACAIPRAGGAFDFGLRAFGPVGGLVLGVAQIVEFLFAPPAIAAAIGAYFNLFFPTVSPSAIAIAAYVAFTGLNIWGSSRPRSSSSPSPWPPSPSCSSSWASRRPTSTPRTSCATRCPAAGRARSRACPSACGCTSASRAWRTSPRRRATHTATSCAASGSRS